MSYWCAISLKKMNAEDVNDFFASLKKFVLQSVGIIAEENFSYSPAFGDILQNNIEVPFQKYKYNEKQETWARQIFSYRWFYLKEQKVLGVFGVPTCMRQFFDSTIFFQNSTDQDYDFETWGKIDFLREIANKWKNMPEEEVKKVFDFDLDSNIGLTKLDYYRKSACYKEIWETFFEDKLYDDDKAVYVSLITQKMGDYSFVYCFARKCYELAIEWYKKEIDKK